MKYPEQFYYSPLALEVLVWTMSLFFDLHGEISICQSISILSLCWNFLNLIFENPICSLCLHWRLARHYFCWVCKWDCLYTWKEEGKRTNWIYWLHAGYFTFIILFNVLNTKAGKWYYCPTSHLRNWLCFSYPFNF